MFLLFCWRSGTADVAKAKARDRPSSMTNQGRKMKAAKNTRRDAVGVIGVIALLDRDQTCSSSRRPPPFSLQQPGIRHRRGSSILSLDIIRCSSRRVFVPVIIAIGQQHRSSVFIRRVILFRVRRPPPPQSGARARQPAERTAKSQTGPQPQSKDHKPSNILITTEGIVHLLSLALHGTTTQISDRHVECRA